jgi:hypothetical protein
MNPRIAITKTVLKVFLGATISQLLTNKIGLTDLPLDAWTTALNSGLAAALVTVYNYLDVTDTRYGRGHE